MEETFTLELPERRRHTAAARRAVAERLRRPRRCGELLLCVSEVVTNAVLHARSAATMTVRRTADLLTVEVQRRRPHPARAPAALHHRHHRARPAHPRRPGRCAGAPVPPRGQGRVVRLRPRGRRRERPHGLVVRAAPRPAGGDPPSVGRAPGGTAARAGLHRARRTPPTPRRPGCRPSPTSSPGGTAALTGAQTERLLDAIGGRARAPSTSSSSCRPTSSTPPCTSARSSTSWTTSAARATCSPSSRRPSCAPTGAGCSASSSARSATGAVRRPGDRPRGPARRGARRRDAGRPRRRVDDDLDLATAPAVRQRCSISIDRGRHRHHRRPVRL